MLRLCYGHALFVSFFNLAAWRCSPSGPLGIFATVSVRESAAYRRQDHVALTIPVRRLLQHGDPDVLVPEIVCQNKRRGSG